MSEACWVAHVDGASRGNPGPSGVGVVIVSPDGEGVCELSKAVGITTNNVAEYLGLIYALQEALKRRLPRLLVRTDSQLLARQVTGEYQVKNPELQRLHGLVRHLAEGFEHFAIEHVPREMNTRADRLAGLAVRTAPGA